MNLLFYIRPDIFAFSEPGYDPTELWVEQDSKRMVEVLPGETIWVFSRWPREGNRYFLDSLLIVDHWEISRPPIYGHRRIYGGPDSVVFLPDGQPDLAPLLRSTSLTIHADYLAKSFQGHAAVRRLLDEDHEKLVRWSEDLKQL